MGEWDRLKSDFVRGENFDFLHHHGFAVETQALKTFVAEAGIEQLRVPRPAQRGARAVDHHLPVLRL
jgi:hypothetical protein